MSNTKPTSKSLERDSTDPVLYTDYIKRFTSEQQPTSPESWISRAQSVAQILSYDAPSRDINQKIPRAEIELLKASRLTVVLGPQQYGGGGETWETGYKVIREVAKGDGSIGMLLGYHLLWSTTANVVGTLEQAASVQQVVIEQNYFIGGAVNPRDSDLKITDAGDEIVFNGFKNFNTGGVVSDLTVLEGVLEGTEDHIFTFVKTDQPGVQFLHNWDSIGMRLTESGSVRIDNIAVPWTDALGWDARTKRPIPSVLGIPFASLLLPTIQLVFSNFYLGIAQGALNAGSKYTAENTRSWPFGGDNKEKATEEWYILERYGTFKAHLEAADALADRAGAKVAELYTEAGQHGSTLLDGVTNGTNGTSNGNGHPTDKRSSITPERRGEVAVYVAHVKVVTTDTGLTVTSGVFELLGSRATGRKYGFDRFWRDLRTHTLHDPVAYKKREVGSYQLLGELPEPTWYT
ncbi:acyl-CoA dehydrogenase NM domain-like protein [Polychaeton citri CBS 116435]|uniref:Acyl-CoA dehydrogenase NM domain-like protein n=1 Tax=Polychaeton citri CBS 116435 TaxID=1314669 RepID=A0A9P4QII9_9PEZI|nr:acyl-CoA dehydrogenase NM domain-like protein [Polychaeton citri CBS 116435]